jgi:hypothetical protein
MRRRARGRKWRKWKLMGLSEEAGDYHAFWREKYGKEYQAVVVRRMCSSWGRKRESRRSWREMRQMKWRGMGWLWDH